LKYFLADKFMKHHQFSQFTKHKGYYVRNTPLQKISYTGYTTKRNAQQKKFYTDRKHILRTSFFNILLPIVQRTHRLYPKQTLFILDAGCGDGVALRALLDIHTKTKIPMKLFGMDIDETIKKDLPPSVAFSKGSLTKILFPKNTFHMIISLQTLEHLSPLDVQATLREFHRVLQPQGIVYVETPNPESVQSQVMGNTWYMLLPEHLTLLPPKPLKDMFIKEGFQYIKCTTRVEDDSQINEAWNILRKISFPGLRYIPWRTKLFLLKWILYCFYKGAITTGLAEK